MHRFQPRDSTALYSAIIATSLAVLVVDLFTELGIAEWVFYLAPLTLTLLCWNPNIALFAAAAQTAFTLIGFELSPEGIDRSIAALNRGFGIVTMWLVAFTAWYFIRGKLAVRRQEWLQSGQTKLSATMAGEQTLEQLGGNILRCLSEYLQAQAAVMYVQRNGSFDRIATYAMTPMGDVPDSFQAGEGLLGQALKDVKTFVVSNVPEGYWSIGSGLGRNRPRHLLIAPAVVDGSVNAMLEFGFFQPVDDATTELLERASNAIAMTVRSAKFRLQLQEYLEETQRQAEELQAQSEELRVSNEELERQSAVLKESQLRLEHQQMELEQTNAQLEEYTQTLESQKVDLLRTRTDLELQTHELEQASRYKSDFLASMSHELRTPLNSALIFARLLFENRDGNLTPEQVKYAKSIESSGNALLELINDVLDLAKVEAGRLDIRAQRVSVSKVVETMRTMFEPVAAEKKIALTMRILPGAPATLETDSQRLEQVLKNLLANAIKFTAQGEVRLEVTPAADGRVAFEVRDTGIGIPEDQQQIIFEPFRQVNSAANRKYGGTGLGLSISRELVRLLGGEIRLESVLGEGSRFTILLPEHYQPVEAPVETASRVSATAGTAGPPPPPTRRAAVAARVEDDRQKLSGNDRVILVVEDDELFAQILRDLSHELHFQCLIAPTAAEALVLAAQYSPSGIVLDVGLPDHSGLSLLDRLKLDVRTRHIPVHMVSVHDYAETALALGAIGYALKPVKRAQLVEAFQRLEERLAQKLRRVLIVEDEETQRESLQQLLGSREVEAVCVATAADCLQQLHTTTFDCMVLDLGLPDSSGYTLLETISHEDRYSFPPVIVYTGRELTEDEEQTLRRYSKSIIIKGAKSPERLLDEVTLFLHQVVSELPPEKQRMIEKARSRDSLLEGRHVLIVEDDVRNVFALTSILEPRGVKIQIARNGREALEVLERNLQQEGPPVDLVLMDIMMPEMDGLTATREIRKRQAFGRLPVIALTAKAMKSDQEQIIAAGANDYMAKPLDVEQLLSVMRVWMPR